MEPKPVADFPAVTGAQPWIRKVRTLFRRLDSQGRGSLGVDNFLDLASRLLSSFPKAENFYSDELVQGMIHLWYGIICQEGEEHQRTRLKMNESQFIEAMLKCINKKFKEEFVQFVISPFFDVADANRDGFIEQPEFNLIMAAWRADPKESELVFRLLDIKENKKHLSKIQFEGLMAEYFFDETLKGKTIKVWGPLINYKRPEDYPDCECGPTWEGKMRTMFRRLDISQSGKLRCHDFLQIARSLAQRNHLDKAKSDAVMRTMLEIWVHYISVDKDGHHFTELTEKGFIHNLRSMINGQFRHALDQFGWTFFKAVEVEGRGFISVAEYRNLQEAWHVGRAEAEGMFKVLDTDKDGKISSDEYLSAWVEYFLGEDSSSPYKTFFGPIISKPPASERQD